MQIVASVHLNFCDSPWPPALINKCHRSSLLSRGVTGEEGQVVPLLPRQSWCMYQLCFCILWARGQSRDCVWEKISSGAVEVTAEERMTSPRQSTESQRNACQPSPSITHVLLLVTLTNSIEKVIKTKQPHQTANNSPTRKSWTEILAVNLGLWRARGRVCRSSCCPTFLFSLKNIGPNSVLQCSPGHTGFRALGLHPVLH